MSSTVLDEIDRGILHLLQGDARHLTPVDIAKLLPVSDGTVRNRIDGLERQGVIEGYVPTINYEAAGFPLKIVFTCSAPVTERAALAERALQIDGIVNVREMMTSGHNIQIVGIATHTDDITRVAMQLQDVGLVLEREELMRHEYVQPFNHFGADVPEGAADPAVDP